MTPFKNFEEMESWQKARKLAGMVYELTRREQFSRDFGLRDQIQRAAGSIMHNIAEGFEAGYDPEFVRFLRIARRSASEVQSELYLAQDAGYINQDELKNAYALSVETKKLINGLITYLSNNSKPTK
ncbi:MAG TPA: four helix bundle protein [Anaerolineales bacterium]|jgi:four helix bundle protein